MTVILAYKESDSSRRKNLEAILKYYSMFKNISLVVVEEDKKEYAKDLVESCNGKYIFIYSPNGLWSRSLAFNVGYKNSLDNWFLFAEIDVIIDPLEMAADFKIIEESKDLLLLKPYDDLIDLNSDKTDLLINNNFYYDIKNIDLTNQLNSNYSIFCKGINKEYREMINLAGGNIAISRKAFEIVGGWDEQFLGWGCDDDAMSNKLLRLVPDKLLVQTHTGFHMWHNGSEKSNTDKITWNEYYKANYDNLKTIVRYSDKELQNYCENNLKIIGDDTKWKI